MKNIWKLFLSIIFCELAGGIGAIFTTPAISAWYVTLQKPSFTPPNWLFAPVWTLLFALMGIALYLVWTNKSQEKKTAYIFFFIQLSLNILWSIFFFGLHNPGLAFADIILLWLTIIFTIIYFYKISKVAGLILLPYILWVSLATALNYAVMVLN